MTTYGVTPNNTFSPHHKKYIKKEVVDFAKGCPLYFASIFPVMVIFFTVFIFIYIISMKSKTAKKYCVMLVFIY